MKGIKDLTLVSIMVLLVVTIGSFSILSDGAYATSGDYICDGVDVNGKVIIKNKDVYINDCTFNGKLIIENSIVHYLTNSKLNGGIYAPCPTEIILMENNTINGQTDICTLAEDDNGWILEAVDCNVLDYKNTWKELSNDNICFRLKNTYDRNRWVRTGIDFNGKTLEDIGFGIFDNNADIKIQEPIYGTCTGEVPRNATFDCSEEGFYYINQNKCGYDYSCITGYDWTTTTGYGIHYFQDSAWNEVEQSVYELDAVEIGRSTGTDNQKVFVINAKRIANINTQWKFDLYSYENGTEIKTTLDPWWNSDWNMSSTVTLTNPDAIPHTNETIRATFEHLGLIDTNCSDVRVVNPYGNEIPRTVLQTLVEWDENSMGSQSLWKHMSAEYVYNSSYCSVFFFADIPASSTADYVIYYNNSGIGEPTQTEWPFKIEDNFDTETTGTEPSRWVVSASQGPSEYLEISTSYAYSGTKSVKMYDADDMDYVSMRMYFYNSTYLTGVMNQRQIAHTGSFYSNYETLNSNEVGYIIYDTYLAPTTTSWYRRIYGNNLTRQWSQRGYLSTNPDTLTMTGEGNPSTAPDFSGVSNVWYAEYGHSSGPRDESYYDSANYTNGIFYYNLSNISIGSPTGYSGDVLIYNNVTNHADLSFEYGDFFSTNITALNNSEGTVVGGVWFEWNGTTNYTGINISQIAGYNGGIHNWNDTLTLLTTGDYEIKQFVESVGDAKNYTNLSTIFTISYDLLSNTSAYMSISPSTTEYYGATTTATCSSNDLNAQLTLYKNGTQISNPDVGVLGEGVYNYTCAANQTGWHNATNESSLTIVSGLNITSYTVCGAGSYDSFHLYAFNATGDSYYQDVVQINEVVPASLLPIGNTNFQIVNDTSTQTNATFNLTLLENFYTERTADGYSEPYMDFDVKDEDTGSNIYFDAEVYNSTDSINNSDVLNFTRSWTGIPHGELAIKLSNSSDLYVTRYYYTDMELCGADYNTTLYMLSAADGHYVRYHIYTTAGSPISGALVTIERSISGTWTVVEEAESDGSGTATTWLDPDATYRVTVAATGFTTYQTTMRPTEDDYNVILGISAVIDREFMYDNIRFEWWPKPTSINTMNSSVVGYEYSINWTIESFDAQLSGYGLEILWNDTVIYSLSESNATGSTLYATFNITGNTTDENIIEARAYFNKVSFTQTEYIYKNYVIIDVTPGDHSLFTWIPGLGLSAELAGIIIIILSIIVGILVSYGTSNNYIGGGAVLLTLNMGAILGMFDVTVLGFLWLGYTSIVALRGGI